jgi:hypothetical protein
MASGISLSHIVAVIDRHLTDYRSRYYSGSGDALFSWVDGIIRKTPSRIVYGHCLGDGAGMAPTRRCPQ